MKKILSMDWVKQFSCIGGSCPLTCCRGWKINLTEREIEIYKNLRHPFRKEILQTVDAENLCMKTPNDRCGLLTEDGWCSLVRECGEEYLSGTCKVFPRGCHAFGDIEEVYVEILCPVVAGYLMTTEKIMFHITELEQEVTEEVDYCLYDALSLARTFLIELFQSYEGYHTGKCYILLSVMDMVSNLYKQERLDKVNVISELIPYNQDENCMQIFSAGEAIAENLELKVQRLYGVIRRLAENHYLEQIFCNLKDILSYQNINIWLNDAQELFKDVKSFVIYFRKHYRCFAENFFVYSLFMHWIPNQLDMNIFGKKIKVGILEFSLIQLCVMSIWKQKGEVSEHEYEIIIAGIARLLERNGDMFKTINNFLEEEGDSVVENLLLLIC